MGRAILTPEQKLVNTVRRQLKLIQELKEELKQEEVAHTREVAGLHATVESLKKTIASQEAEIDKLEDEAKNSSHNIKQVQERLEYVEKWRQVNLHTVSTQAIAMELMADEIKKLRKDPVMIIDCTDEV